MFSRNDLVRDSYPRPLEPTLGSLCFPRRHGRRGLRRLDHDHNADNRRARRRGAVVEYRVGGTPVTATLTLTAVAPAGGAAVTLASSNAAVVVPASVTIPEGTNALSFSVATTSAAASTIITATYAGASQTATLTTTVVTVSALQGLFLSNSVSIAGVRSERRAPRPAGGSRSAAAILRSSHPQRSWFRVEREVSVIARDGDCVERHGRHVSISDADSGFSLWTVGLSVTP
jgi:hypothetical protein